MPPWPPARSASNWIARSARGLRAHSRCDIVHRALGEEQADEILAVAGARGAARGILGVVAGADERGIADATGMLRRDAAGGRPRGDAALRVHRDRADGAVLVGVVMHVLIRDAWMPHGAGRRLRREIHVVALAVPLLPPSILRGRHQLAWVAERHPRFLGELLGALSR